MQFVDGNRIDLSFVPLDLIHHRLKDSLNKAILDRDGLLADMPPSSEINGWDEDCKWLEDWDFFLRTNLAFPDKIKWIPEILFEYRQVHGEGADGICAEAREKPSVEQAGRQYLAKKWNTRLTQKGLQKLSVSIDDLLPVRSLVGQD